jgi:hypothetical protein
VTHSPGAFFALDLGAATNSAALVGRVAGHWRLVGSLAFPAAIPHESIADLLVERLQATDPALAQELGITAGGDGAATGWARLTARSSAPAGLAVLAVSERSLGSLVRVAEGTGWRLRPLSAERLDPLTMTRQLLDRELTAVLIGAGDPPGADERNGLGDLAALVAAVAGRRPELHVVLAGAMAEQLPRFESADGRPGDVLLGLAATHGTPPGAALRELLDRLRREPDDARAATIRSAASLAEVLGRRVEVVDIGVDAGLRVLAGPAAADRQPEVAWSVVAGAGLVPEDPDELVVDAALRWTTQAIDRHRMRDRLRELRLAPWTDVAGDGAPFRLTAARAALSRLVEATPDIDALPPADLLIVCGGAWAVAPGPAIALAVADVVRRPGVTQVCFDHARLLGPLGVIDNAAERQAMLADLADDLLAPLGTVVMPAGLRGGRSDGRLVVHGASGAAELELVAGGLELVDLPPGESAVAEFQFRDAVRLGTRGRHFAVDVAGGLGGLLVDLRDVPMRLPERADRRRELLAEWQSALWAGSEA